MIYLVRYARNEIARGDQPPTVEDEQPNVFKRKQLSPQSQTMQPEKNWAGNPFHEPTKPRDKGSSAILPFLALNFFRGRFTQKREGIRILGRGSKLFIGKDNCRDECDGSRQRPKLEHRRQRPAVFKIKSLETQKYVAGNGKETRNERDDGSLVSREKCADVEIRHLHPASSK